MRYFGRIEAPKGPKNCPKTLQPSAPEIFWGLQLFLSSYMTFLSLSILFKPLTKPDPHFSPTVQ